MRLETFRGVALNRVFDSVREAMGEDAMIVKTRVIRDGRVAEVEVTAVLAREVEEFRQRLEPGPFEAPKPRAEGAPWPTLIALVGPSGAGKSSVAARAAATDELRERRVGLLVLGEHRRTLLPTAGEPRFECVERVLEPAALDEAILRLCECCDAVVIDTPSLAPRDGGAGGRWMAMLASATPDETHLVLPAGLRTEVAMALREDYFRCAPTHLLLTKMDEVPGGASAVELALRLEMPSRWLADAPEGFGALRAAPARILSMLGVDEPATERAA